MGLYKAAGTVLPTRDASQIFLIDIPAQKLAHQILHMRPFLPMKSAVLAAGTGGLSTKLLLDLKINHKK